MLIAIRKRCAVAHTLISPVFSIISANLRRICDACERFSVWAESRCFLLIFVRFYGRLSPDTDNSIHFYSFLSI